MSRLITKVQYNNFETGEFVNVQERNYKETLELIEGFPWNAQRDHIVIDLTNPSILILGRNNDFLKFAVFFNQKYVLHYFDARQTLYTRSFVNLKDGYSYIKNFFEQPEFEVEDFKKEITWFQHNLKHFIQQDFKYLLTSKSIKTYLILTSWLSFSFSIILLLLILPIGISSLNFVALGFFLLFFFLFGGGLNLILFFNYYNFVKDKILIMSKGKDDFYFGPINYPIKYDKKDILHYTIVRTGSQRSPFYEFAFVKIEFKNGVVLKIPNLLVNDLAIKEKLFEYKRIDQYRFPYMKL